MRTSLLALLAILVTNRTAPAGEPPAGNEKAVREVLDAQITAWNKGDIDGFMKGYWKDEKLTFISGGSMRP